MPTLFRFLIVNHISWIFNFRRYKLTMALTIVLYNSILLFSTLFIYLSEKTTTVLQRKICLVIAFLIIFIPAAIRYFVGVDLPNYEVAFYQIKEGIDV